MKLTFKLKCLLLQTLGVALAAALTPTLALAAEPAYTYCISHANDPACSPGGAEAVNDALISDPNNWAMQAGDFANTRYSALKQVNKSNVNKLQVAWMFSTGVLRGHEGSPLVIGNNMYLVTPFPNNVFAIDLTTQKIKWKYAPKQDPAVIPQMCCDTVNRGVAYAPGKVFMQQADSTLVALDAETGKVIWSVRNGDPKVGAVNTNAPHVFEEQGDHGHQRRRVGRARLYLGVRHQYRQAGVAGLQHWSGRRDADRPADHHHLEGRQGPAGRGELEPADLARRPVEDRRRHHLGLVQL